MILCVPKKKYVALIISYLKPSTLTVKCQAKIAFHLGGKEASFREIQNRFETIPVPLLGSLFIIVAPYSNTNI